ncbi:MAG TPA: alanine racemase, partial [Hyphomicrobiaceae bacterium]
MTETTASTETLRGRTPIPLSARAVLTVDLAALRANWARLNEVSGRAECAGVLKADAYGLGLAQVARALTNEGCKTFFVATIDEG